MPLPAYLVDPAFIAPPGTSASSRSGARPKPWVFRRERVWIEETACAQILRAAPSQRPLVAEARDVQSRVEGALRPAAVGCRARRASGIRCRWGPRPAAHADGGAIAGAGVLEGLLGLSGAEFRLRVLVGRPSRRSSVSRGSIRRRPPCGGSPCSGESRLARVSGQRPTGSPAARLELRGDPDRAGDDSMTIRGA